MTTVQVQALKPGQEVAIQNDSRTATVIRRVSSGRYLVAWCGREIEMLRNQLAVRVNGRWVEGPYNTTDVI